MEKWIKKEAIAIEVDGVYVAGKVGSQTKIKIHHLVIKGIHFEENEGNSMEKKKTFNFSSTTRLFLSVLWSFIAEFLLVKYCQTISSIQSKNY